MAAASLIPKNGNITYGSFTADYAAFSITARQNTENCSAYGAATCAKNVGSGTPDFDFSISAFALAHGTGNAPALPTISASGSSTTFTLDTGVTESCVAVCKQVSIGHGRMRAAVNYNIDLANYGDVTEVWPVT